MKIYKKDEVGLKDIIFQEINDIEDKWVKEGNKRKDQTEGDIQYEIPSYHSSSGD